MKKLWSIWHYYKLNSMMTQLLTSRMGVVCIHFLVKEKLKKRKKKAIIIIITDFTHWCIIVCRRIWCHEIRRMDISLLVLSNPIKTNLISVKLYILTSQEHHRKICYYSSIFCCCVLFNECGKNLTACVVRLKKQNQC